MNICEIYNNLTQFSWHDNHIFWFSFDFQHCVLLSDVVEKTSTRRRSRIPCVVVEKITTRRREWRRHCRRKKLRKPTNFQQKFVWFSYSNNAHRNSGCPLHIFIYKTNKQFNKKTKLWKQNGQRLDDV